MSATQSDWWRRLAGRAAQPPALPRRTLRLDGVASPVGSVERSLGDRLRAAGLPMHLTDDDSEFVSGAPNEALAEIARWLTAHGLGARWRDELLPVCDEGGVRHAVVERAAVRPLGIATHAVHLIGLTPDGKVWVQQRAFDKATDPGQWDTLVGGLVAAQEHDNSGALERETWVEAGLRIGDLGPLRAVDPLTIRRPVTEGYMVEHIQVFEAVVPAGVTPANQDGEVAAFECLQPGELAARLASGLFTLEASLMLAASLRRRGLL